MINELSLARLKTGSLNPRHYFDDAAHIELTSSVALDGVLENLIVRPEWCVGLITANDLANAHGKNVPEDQIDFEVVSGERRLRAATAVAGEKKIALADYLVPVRVKAMTDPEALRINLTEQMQRNQLTPLEEAEGFAQMLAYKDEQGEPLHTTESLAASVGKSSKYVSTRLTLRRLPTSQKKALASGGLVVSVAELIARVPDAEDREKFGAMCLTGGRDGHALTFVEAEGLLAEQFQVQLKGAPFDQEDPALVPASGRCSLCPHRSGNNPEFAKRRARTDMCLNPACFREKCAAAFGLLTVEARANGANVLTDDQSAKCFETVRPTEVRIGGDYVELDTRPMEHLLKNEVKNPPMWRDLVEKAKAAGMSPTVVLAKDGAGRGRWLVEVAPLMAAAAKLGEPIFRGQKGDDDAPPVTPRPGEDADDTFRRGQREHREKQKAEAQAAADAAKKANAVLADAVQTIHGGLSVKWVVAPIWDVLLKLHLNGGDNATLRVLAMIVNAKKELPAKKLIAMAMKAPADGRQSLLPLLLMSSSLIEHGLDSRPLRAIAEHAEVDLGLVYATVMKRLAAKTAPAAKPKPKKPSREVTKAAKKTEKKRGAK
jgi:ParB/RepB/Spo0J family partition protein